MNDRNWPAWYSSPDGSQSKIFNSPDDVPAGWTTGAEKAKAKGGTPAPSPAPAPAPSPAPTASAELDTDGHPWSADRHAASKSKTKDGRWRMKVGVKRPDPAPGYPKQVLDL